MKKDNIASFPGALDGGVDIVIENQDQALMLARMLSFAADEAGEIGAIDCQFLINLSLRDLKEQFALKYDDLITMSPELN